MESIPEDPDGCICLRLKAYKKTEIRIIKPAPIMILFVFIILNPGFWVEISENIGLINYQVISLSGYV